MSLLAPFFVLTTLGFAKNDPSIYLSPRTNVTLVIFSPPTKPTLRFPTSTTAKGKKQSVPFFIPLSGRKIDISHPFYALSHPSALNPHFPLTWLIRFSVFLSLPPAIMGLVKGLEGEASISKIDVFSIEE